MKLSLKSITPLNPCKDRLDNYVKYYKYREFTPRQFMGLKNITHQDKLWVAFRVLDSKSISLAAADIAESVLSIYEKKYPKDKRPREAIEATRQYIKGEITLEQLREKRNAAYAAYAADAAYAAAAYAADAAAAYAAYAAAAYAAAAYAADAAYAAAAADASRGSAKAAQEKLCRTIILRYWK